MINSRTITGIDGHERTHLATIGGNEPTNQSGNGKIADRKRGSGEIADGGGGGRTTTFDGWRP